MSTGSPSTSPSTMSELEERWFNDLAGYLKKVRERAYTVTDAEVEALTASGLTEDEIFEHTVAAALGEGIRRLDAAFAAIDA